MAVGAAVAVLGAHGFAPALGQVARPDARPGFVASAHRTALLAPLPDADATSEAAQMVPAYRQDFNLSGQVGTWQADGPVATATNAFFQKLGSNGRTCATCHAPQNGMSVSADSVRLRYLRSFGTDPIFAPVDGSNCPSAPYHSAASHSLLTSKGLFRVALPVPLNAEYTLRVVGDPYGCETDSRYSVSMDPDGTPRQVVSVYRRSRPAANLKFVTAVPSSGIFAVPPGTPSGNIMSDGREPSLESQAIDATLIHAQATTPPSAAQVAQMVAFENGVTSAQATDLLAGNLAAQGATGGPSALAAMPAGVNVQPPLALFDAWNGTADGFGPKAWRRASIRRGQDIFNGVTVQFAIDSVGGFNDTIGLNPLPGASCATCHNQQSAGSDLIVGSQRAIGIGGDSPNLRGFALQAGLPVFELTCPAGSTAFNGSTADGLTKVTTSDPGRALITGRCADIGKFTTPTLRALASRAPYFSDGSAGTMTELVRFYDRRFAIGLSPRQEQDLVNFLNAL